MRFDDQASRLIAFFRLSNLGLKGVNFPFIHQKPENHASRHAIRTKFLVRILMESTSHKKHRFSFAELSASERSLTHSYSPPKYKSLNFMYFSTRTT